MSRRPGAVAPADRGSPGFALLGRLDADVVPVPPAPARARPAFRTTDSGPRGPAGAATRAGTRGRGAATRRRGTEPEPAGRARGARRPPRRATAGAPAARRGRRPPSAAHVPTPDPAARGRRPGSGSSEARAVGRCSGRRPPGGRCSRSSTGGAASRAAPARSAPACAVRTNPRRFEMRWTCVSTQMPGLPKPDGDDQVRRLAAHALEREERVEVGRDLPAEALEEVAGDGAEHAGLRPVEADGKDQARDPMPADSRRIAAGEAATPEEPLGRLAGGRVLGPERQEARHQDAERVALRGRDLGHRGGSPGRRPATKRPDHGCRSSWPSSARGPPGRATVARPTTTGERAGDVRNRWLLGAAEGTSRGRRVSNAARRSAARRPGRRALTTRVGPGSSLVMGALHGLATAFLGAGLGVQLFLSYLVAPTTFRLVERPVAVRLMEGIFPGYYGFGLATTTAALALALALALRGGGPAALGRGGAPRADPGRHGVRRTRPACLRRTRRGSAPRPRRRETWRRSSSPGCTGGRWRSTSRSSSPGRWPWRSTWRPGRRRLEPPREP